ncbi:MAG: hypothetical protein ACO1SX_09010 [Actinomycetota bacterium]
MDETSLIVSNATPRRALSPQALLGWSLAALSVAGAASLTLLSPPRQMRTLSDGSKVILEGVTFGRHHAFESEPWWERLLSRLPTATKKVANLSSSLFTAEDSVVVWLSPEAAGGRRPAMPGYSVLADEHGCPFAPSSIAFRPAFRARPNALLYSMVFDAYPRRDPSVRLEVRDFTGRGPAASFNMRVPTPQSFPTWKAGSSAPVAVSVGEVIFTLQRLVHRKELHLREEAVFRVTQNGKPLTDWRPSRITVRDATGNTVVTRSQGLPGHGLAFFAGLCRKETAWKLEVTFERVERAQVLESRTVEFMVKP